MSEEVRGFAEMPRNTRGAFLRQLRFLRGGAGLTQERVGNGTLNWLRSYFGVTTATEAYALIRAALNALDSSQLHVQALLNAYGGEGLADDLKDRRREFAEKHGLNEPRVLHLEDLALDEMVENLDAIARGEEIKSRRPTVIEASIESTEEPSIRDLLNTLIEATREQTTATKEQTDVLWRISNQLKYRR